MKHMKILKLIQFWSSCFYRSIKGSKAASQVIVCRGSVNGIPWFTEGMEFRCKNPHVPTVYEFSKIPLERTPDPQATVYVWEVPFFWECLGMPGVCWN